MDSGHVFLVPVPLAPTEQRQWLSAQQKSIVANLTIFVVENAKTARQWLKHYSHPLPLRDLTILEMKVSDNDEDIRRYLTPLYEGKNIGVMSEAGCPGIADPGAKLVLQAHRAGLRVVPLVGPSSILLALMASGLNGQRFTFHGYIPVDRHERIKAVAALEQRSKRDNETQIFIETPYRNDILFRALLGTCASTTLLCIASDLTGMEEKIATRTIGEWRKKAPNLEKHPAAFLLLAP